MLTAKLPGHIRFILLLYIMGIVFFFIFRVVLLLLNLDKVYLLPDEERFSLLLGSFLIGFRFDTVVSGYILCIPSLLLFVFHFLRKQFKVLHSSVFYLSGTLYTVAFFSCSADIPYFNHYFSRLTTAALNWSGENKFIFNMIAQEKDYFIFFVFFLAVSVMFWYFYIKYLREILLNFQPPVLLKNILFFAIFIPIIFIAIRGRVEFKSPIRVGTAYFSAYAFPNQLGLNPAFTLARSYLDDLSNKSRQLHLLTDDQALGNAARFLNINYGTNWSIPSREYRFVEEPNNANVILILMESMSAEKMGLFGNKYNLTPALDSLAMISYSFTNFYTSGIHTYNGIFSTLYSYPSLLNQHPLKVTVVPRLTGIPVTLKANGYSTVFFTTHDEQFDNMAGFLYSNGFEKIISQKDYPGELVAGATGVPDHVMFESSIPVINSLYNKGKPFFTAMLTSSDHGPYHIPDYIPFKPKSKDIHNQIVEYADWSLSHFMKLASKQKWYQNTIFVFAADHGAAINPVYDMPLSFHHSPFIIYSKFIIDPKVFSNLCGQIDIFPTLMHLLKISYVNSTMGIDIFNEKRPYIYFSNDNKIGCINENYFMIIRMTGGESLYDYRAKSIVDLLNSKKDLADDMRNYTFSMMQSTQYIIKELSKVQEFGIKKTLHTSLNSDYPD